MLINISAVDVRWVHMSAHSPVFLNDRRDTEGDSMLILRSLWWLSCLKQSRVMQIMWNDTIFPPKTSFLDEGVRFMGCAGAGASVTFLRTN